MFIRLFVYSFVRSKTTSKKRNNELTKKRAQKGSYSLLHTKMPLKDIIAAIIAEADARIEQARAAHQKELTLLREQSEKRLSTRKQEIAASKEQKKVQLKAKAQAHADAQRRNAALRKKQELLDRLYSKVATDMGSLPADTVEDLLRKSLKTITEKGTIHPSAKHVDLLKKIAPSEQFTIGETIESTGGFRFVSQKQERDFTFEHLVQEVVRPATELEVSQKLFT